MSPFYYTNMRTYVQFCCMIKPSGIRDKYLFAASISTERANVC